MRSAKLAGSSMVKPETRSEVSNNSWVIDLTVRSFSPSVSTFFFSSLMMGDLGEISKVFLEAMYELMEVSRRACAFMIRSILADQPNWPVRIAQGDPMSL